MLTLLHCWSDRSFNLRDWRNILLLNCMFLSLCKMNHTFYQLTYLVSGCIEPAGLERKLFPTGFQFCTMATFLSPSQCCWTLFTNFFRFVTFHASHFSRIPHHHQKKLWWRWFGLNHKKSERKSCRLMKFLLLFPATSRRALTHCSQIQNCRY